MSQSGNLGIGRSDGIEDVHVAGDMLVTGRITAAEYISPSDLRLKENIKPLSQNNNTLANLQALRGVNYKWNEAAGKLGIENIGNQAMIGVIAQEVELLYPELVRQWQKGYKTVDYSRLNAVLLESFKENQKYLIEMKKRLINLKQQIYQKELLRKHNAD